MSPTHAKDAVNSALARDRPFDPNLVKQARAIAARYHVEIRSETSGYVGTVSEFPSVFGHGASTQATLDTTRDLLMWTIAYLIETGRTPTPSG